MSRVKKLLCGLWIVAIAIVSFHPIEAKATETEVEELGTSGLTYPQLLVESYEIVNGAFERSSECTMRVHIKNIDTEETAVTGSIAMYSAYVYPVFGKTNQITFDAVEPGEDIYVDFEVNLDKIISGPNPVEFVLGWNDENAVHYSNSVQISPVLLEKVGFEISTIRVPETVYGSKNTTLSVSYENIGAENLQNVYMVLDGDLAQGVQVVELDDIASKRKDMVDYSLELLNMGENRISVSFKYEDRNGTEYSTEAIESIITVTDKNYISPTPQKTDVRELLEEYKLFVVCAALAVIMCIPFLIGLIRRGGKRR